MTPCSDASPLLGGIQPAMCEQLTHITFQATDGQWKKLVEYWEGCEFVWVRIDRCTKKPGMVWIQMKRKDQL
jgi:hypothetical protein